MASELPTSGEKARDPLRLEGQLLRARFRVREFLGQGGQCAVYRCERVDAPDAPGIASGIPSGISGGRRPFYAIAPERTPSVAVIKILPVAQARPEVQEMFLSEYRIQSRILDKRLVRTYECFRSDELLCFTQDFLAGGALDALNVPTGGIPVPVAAGLTLQLLEGLSVIHARGVIHRDIKPANLLLSQPLLQCLQTPGILPELRIADFGIADVQDMVFGERGFSRVRGTLLFMAPELIGADTVDARVDIYAAGITLFYLLTGRHPLSLGSSSFAEDAATSDIGSSSLELIEQQMVGAKQAIVDVRAIAPEVPAELAALVTSLLHPDPSQRPRTAAIAFSALHAWFQRHQAEHGYQLPGVAHVSYDPYLSATAFCGRQAELALANSFLAAALNQAPLPAKNSPESLRLSADAMRERLAPSVLRVEGEAGVGKSRLTRQISRRAEASCTEIRIQTERERGAYQQILELGAEFKSKYEEQLTTASLHNRDLLRRLHDPGDALYVPNLEQGTDPRFAPLTATNLSEKEQSELGELGEQFRLERFAATIRLASYAKPLCFIIEDAQWLDRPSLRLLGHTMRYLAVSRADGFSPKVVFVLNHRPKEEGDNLDAVLEELRSVGRLEREPVVIKLAAFSVEDMTQLIQSMLQLTDQKAAAPFAQAFSERGYSLTPLAVEQCLWCLFTGGSLIKRDAQGRWTGEWNLSPALINEASVPAGVREAIGVRAARLDTQTLNVLGIAAVAGKHFDVELVAQVANLTGHEILTALEVAGRAGFVRALSSTPQDYFADAESSAAAYAFIHDRYRETIVERLDAQAKRQIHSNLARATFERWGETDATRESLAEHHFAAGEPGLAAPYATRAAEQAFAALDFDRAGKNYALAIDSLIRHGAEVPIAVREHAAIAYHNIGLFSEATHELNALLADEKLPALTKVAIKRRLAELHHKRGNSQDAIPALLSFLIEHGVDVQRGGVVGALSMLGALLGFLTIPLAPWVMNQKPSPDAAFEEERLLALYTLIECGAMHDYQITVRALVQAILVSRRAGLNGMSGPILRCLGAAAAQAGLHDLSKKYDAMAQAVSLKASSGSRRAAVFADIQNIITVCVMLVRGELGPAYEKTWSSLISRSLQDMRLAGDIRRRYGTYSALGAMMAISGRLNASRALFSAALELAVKVNLPVWQTAEIYHLEHAVNFLTGGFDAIREITIINCISLAESPHVRLSAEADLMLVRAVRGSGNPAALERALSLSRTWLKEQQSDALLLVLSNLLLGAALNDHKCGGRSGRARSLHKVFKAARSQCLGQRHNRPIYLTAVAVLAQSDGEVERSRQLFSEAAAHACQDGLLGVQLMTVLEVARRLLPAGSTEQAYYEAWFKALCANMLAQAPVSLSDLEDGRLPAAPRSGRPGEAARPAPASN